jgi:protein O-GlcNAc transferase
MNSLLLYLVCGILIYLIIRKFLNINLIDQLNNNEDSIPHMSENEINVLKKYLSKSTYYFEFGSGGSTVLAHKYKNIKKITSIESDKEYSKYIQKIASSANIIHINIGDTIEWGKPKNKNNYNNWPNYYKAWLNKDYNPDLILIDGRFRIACALIVALNNGNYQDQIILIHDFNNRSSYHCILDYFDIIESVDTLVVLKIKSNINKDECNKLLLKHSHDYE